MSQGGTPNGVAQVSIVTSLVLTEQLLATLSPTATNEVPPQQPDSPSPLLLLSAAAKSLKAQVTKLSLLTVTTPFTPSAVSSCVQPINDSILPSLVTATLLCTAELYSPSFAAEAKSTCRVILTEYLSLVKLVDARSRDNQPKKELGGPAKKDVTEVTGRVWQNCDEATKFAEQGFSGFIVRKAKQWLELMKDAVKELQDWNPEDEVDVNDLFGDDASEDEETEQTQPQTQEPVSPDDRATISAGVKEQALRVLTRIPQSVHVVVKQRLEKLPLDEGAALLSTARDRLEKILNQTRAISDMIDESAEAMYMGDPELCLKKAGEARALTIETVEAAIPTFNDSEQTTQLDTTEDKYMRRALEWIRQVDTKNGSKTD